MTRFYCTLGLAIFLAALAGCVEPTDPGLAELDRLAMEANYDTCKVNDVANTSVVIQEFEPSSPTAETDPVEIESFEPSQPVEPVENDVPQLTPEQFSQQTQSPRYPSASEPVRPPVRLRAGVALPQTGPEGTLMSFSVDYEFTSESPQTSSQYRWVIRDKNGMAGAVPVKLNRQGNLMVMVGNLRPEQGPYESWLEEKPRSGDVRVLSNYEEMR